MHILNDILNNKDLSLYYKMKPLYGSSDGYKWLKFPMFFRIIRPITHY